MKITLEFETDLSPSQTRQILYDALGEFLSSRQQLTRVRTRYPELTGKAYDEKVNYNNNRVKTAEAILKAVSDAPEFQ